MEKALLLKKGEGVHEIEQPKVRDQLIQDLDFNQWLPEETWSTAETPVKKTTKEIGGVGDM